MRPSGETCGSLTSSTRYMSSEVSTLRAAAGSDASADAAHSANITPAARLVRAAKGERSASLIFAPAIAQPHSNDSRLVGRVAAIVVGSVRIDDGVLVEQVGDVGFRGPRFVRPLDAQAQVRDIVGRLQRTAETIGI